MLTVKMLTVIMLTVIMLNGRNAGGHLSDLIILYCRRQCNRGL